MKAKSEVRAEILKKRNLMTHEEVREESKKLISDLKELIADINKNVSADKCILAYMPLGNEADLREFYKEIYDKKAETGLELAFPRVYKKQMSFLKVNSDADFELSAFGILEPKKELEVIYPKNNIVIVPCIAIHKDKTRLGFGGGYYDRFFENRNNNILIGIAYDFQKDKEFYYDTYDIKMDYVI